MHLCPKCYCVTAISVCVCVAAWHETQETCWSLPRTLSACAPMVATLPDNHNEPYDPPPGFIVAPVVIASTGTTAWPMYFDLTRPPVLP
jgi:hypothetical protein